MLWLFRQLNGTSKFVHLKMTLCTKKLITWIVNTSERKQKASNRVRGSNKIKVDSRNFSFFWMYQTGDVSTRKYNTKFGRMCEKKNSRTFSFTKMKKNGENLVFQKDFWSFKLKFKFNEKKSEETRKQS